MTIEDTFSSFLSKVKHLGRALRHRNYRLFFIGQAFTSVGNWMQMTALPWLIYAMTNELSLLGVVLFCGQLPFLLLTPLAGVVADRVPRRSILIVTSSLAIAQALALAVLFYFGLLTPGVIILLSVCLGVIGAFDSPTRQSFVVDMVPSREDLTNAIALNSFAFNGARLVGPSLAGVLYAAFGAGVCFLSNAILILAVIVALLMMRMPPRAASAPHAHPLRQFADGVSYVWRFPLVRSVIVFIALICFVGMPYAVLMPYFARNVFDSYAPSLAHIISFFGFDVRDPHSLVYGFIMASVGVGALIGALFLASRRSYAGLCRLVPLSAALWAVSLLLFSLTSSFALALLLLVLGGVGQMLALAGSNTILQSVVADDKRGRVMALFVLAFMGAMPFGSLIAGFVADRVGAPLTLRCASILLLAAALFFSFRLPLLAHTTHPDSLT